MSKIDGLPPAVDEPLTEAAATEAELAVAPEHLLDPPLEGGEPSRHLPR